MPGVLRRHEAAAGPWPGRCWPPFDALLLDEPFTGLDRENRDRALAAVRETAGGSAPSCW